MDALSLNDMTNLINKTKSEMEKVIVHLKTLYKGISAGKADPELLSTIKVSCYGSKSPVNQLAVISIADFSTLQIQPFDSQLVNEIAKAISLSSLNLQVEKAKTSLLVKLPQLTGESRKKLVKHAEEVTEQQRVALRQVRQNIRKELKATDFPKDEKKGLEKKIDVISKEFSSILESLLESKKQDLLTK